MRGALVRKITHWTKTDFITFCFNRQMLTMAEAIGAVQMDNPKGMGEFVVSQSLREIREFFYHDDLQEQRFADALAALKRGCIPAHAFRKTSS